MTRIIDVAAYIIRQYNAVTGEILDEMKLHKLLYFTQRETIAATGEPAFNEVFEGWKYGPVSSIMVKDFWTKKSSKKVFFIAA